MEKKVNSSILQTLIYSDIFDYPLTKDEIWKFLIGKKIDKQSFDKILKNNSDTIIFSNNLYCLIGREKVVKTRIKRKRESQKKIVIAKKIIKQLSFLPTVEFIGISGALSLENSNKDDDIDLFVITSKGSLWLTRLAIIILLLLMGRYRRRNQRKVSDKICLNMLIDESALSFHINRQNLYTAHETVQMMPAFERGGTYNKFISANKWVGKFLPNAFHRGTKRNYTRKYAESFISVVLRLSAIEKVAKKLQIWYMKKQMTNETISSNMLAFHPFDYKEKVLREYKKRLKLYAI